MAGKIIADTIETGAGADISTSYVVNGTPKGFAYWNQETPAIVDSMNTSSLTDSAQGVGGINWSSAMSSATYMCTTGAPTVSSTTPYVAATLDDDIYGYVTKTTTFWPFNTTYSHATAGASYYDARGSICSATGDLA